jgi:uncharacterized protein YbjT (DUF2867 family)
MRMAIAGATGMVGRELVAQAKAAGHDVVELSRSTGVDLVAGTGVDDALAGVEVVVDVTNAPATDAAAASAWFTAIGTNLGAAATRAGVQRTVLLSIIGIDDTPEVDHYVAKVAHERATTEHAPGPVIVRAAQFHEFAGQVLEWGRDGDATTIATKPVQPVALAEVARVLLDVATHGADQAIVEVAGPRPEQLGDMVARLVAATGEQVRVITVPGTAAELGGSLLPGPDAILTGPDFATWLAAR